MPGSGADILGMRPAEFYRLVQKEVERELERRFPQYIDDESLLDIYTEWLVFQIPNLGHHSHKDSSKTIRRGCGYLSSRNYNKGLVLNAFSRHKDRYIRDYPEGSRAFNLARRDATTLTVRMIYIVPERPVVQIFQSTVTNQIVRIIWNTRTDVSPRIMAMTHDIMSLQIAATYCIVANPQVAGMSHAAGSRRLAPMYHAKPLIRVILRDQSIGRKRSDGRLSPWDDIYPPPKKPRQQDDIEGGLPWDDIEAPRRENNQGNSVDSSTAKQIIALDYEPAPNVDPKKAAPSLGYAKAVEELTDAEWKQAGTEANAFLEAFGRELAECPELGASADLRDECNSDSLTYSSASPVSSTGQPRPPANSAPDDDENVFMADVLDDIAEPTRSMSCEIDEDQPCSHPDIVPFQTLKSLQRDPPYDPGVLNLFRWKNSHVYINVARRRNAVDLYTETEGERATVKMSNLAV
ncbi:hypothetical protein LZ32DRAFT_629803 [Colletotrichum eremochloae]|nr:hypothetical protein LZ32DRAFT_629803 [Colletotrichum eremochloae]